MGIMPYEPLSAPFPVHFPSHHASEIIVIEDAHTFICASKSILSTDIQRRLQNGSELRWV